MSTLCILLLRWQQHNSYVALSGWPRFCSILCQSTHFVSPLAYCTQADVEVSQGEMLWEPYTGVQHPEPQHALTLEICLSIPSAAFSSAQSVGRAKVSQRTDEFQSSETEIERTQVERKMLAQNCKVQKALDSQWHICAFPSLDSHFAADCRISVS